MCSFARHNWLSGFACVLTCERFWALAPEIGGAHSEPKQGVSHTQQKLPKLPSFLHTFTIFITCETLYPPSRNWGKTFFSPSSHRRQTLFPLFHFTRGRIEGGRCRTSLQFHFPRNNFTSSSPQPPIIALSITLTFSSHPLGRHLRVALVKQTGIDHSIKEGEGKARDTSVLFSLSLSLTRFLFLSLSPAATSSRFTPLFLILSFSQRCPLRLLFSPPRFSADNSVNV